VRAHRAAERLQGIPGVRLAFDGPYFNEFVLRLPREAGDVCRHVRERSGIWPGLDLGRFWPEMADCLMVCVTETKTREDVEALRAALEDALQ
jgi:glycine dehydrogenase subunit 1